MQVTALKAGLVTLILLPPRLHHFVLNAPHHRVLTSMRQLGQVNVSHTLCAALISHVGMSFTLGVLAPLPMWIIAVPPGATKPDQRTHQHQHQIMC